MNRAGLIAIVWVFLVSVTNAKTDFFTQSFSVNPTFFQRGEGESEANPQHAQEVLEEAGISFPVGASVIYNPATSQLVIRNTRDQIELVEALFESIEEGVEKQIYLTFREVVISSDTSEELGFDWLIELPQSDSTPEKGKSLRSLEAFREELSRPPNTID